MGRKDKPAEDADDARTFIVCACGDRMETADYAAHEETHETEG